MLITGASGYLGSALVKHFSSKYEIIRLVHRKKEEGSVVIDLTNEKEVKALSKKYKPNYILHAAGRKMKQCEENPNEALVNSLSSRYLVKYFYSSLIYYFSTDFVFDGAKGNYRETDSPSPSTVYGITKYEGEKVYNISRHCIVRTAGLFDPRNLGFIGNIIQHLSENKSIGAFNDIYNNPTYIPHFLDYIDKMLELNITGLFHVAGSERISRLEFARIVAKTLGYDENLVKSRKAPLSFLNPRDSSLDSSKIRALLGLAWPDLSSVIKEVCQKDC